MSPTMAIRRRRHTKRATYSVGFAGIRLQRTKFDYIGMIVTSTMIDRSAMNDDESKIRELVTTWMDATKAGDIAAVLALMTDDVVFMTPGQPPFGKKEFAANAGRMRDVKMDGHCDIKEIEVFGNRAYVRNHLQIALTKQGEPPMRMSGYTLGILRKDADGHWRLARDANLVMPEIA